MKKLTILFLTLLSGCTINLPARQSCPSYGDCPFLIGSIKPNKTQIENTKKRGGGGAIVIYKTPPIYPQYALALEIEGYVIIEYDVNPNGDPINFRVIKAKPVDVFDESAIQSAKNYKYEPSLQGYKDIKTKVFFNIEGAHSN